MNGAKKFHSPDGPAFNPGEIWVGSSGEAVEVYATQRYGIDKWDVDVYYTPHGPNAAEIGYRKNAWSFQVRYQHKADLEI